MYLNPLLILFSSGKIKKNQPHAAVNLFSSLGNQIPHAAVNLFSSLGNQIE